MRREPTPEQKQRSEERRERFRALAKQIGSLSDAERSAMAAKLPAIATVEGRVLSLHNQLLLATQRADVTIVGGFHQWKSAGRVVRKGESGLALWIPTTVKSADGGEGETRFLIGYVFDIGQTEQVAP